MFFLVVGLFLRHRVREDFYSAFFRPCRILDSINVKLNIQIELLEYMNQMIDKVEIRVK